MQPESVSPVKAAAFDFAARNRTVARSLPGQAQPLTEKIWALMSTPSKKRSQVQPKTVGRELGPDVPRLGRYARFE